MRLLDNDTNMSEGKETIYLSHHPKNQDVRSNNNRKEVGILHLLEDE